MIRFLRLPAVIARVSMSRSAIYRRVKCHEFPQPVPLGSARTVAWIEHEIAEWQQAQIAAARGAITDQAA